MERIEELLNRYFEGETSIAEERELREFFRTTQILPPQWKQYRTIFGFFDSEREIVSERASLIPTKHKVRKITWLSTAAAAACIAFAVLYEVNEPTLVVAERSVAQEVKVVKVEEVNRIAPQPEKVEPIAISKSKKDSKKIAPVKEKKANPRIVKPEQKKKTIDALEEVNGVESSLRKFEVIRDVNRSLSPLSSLAYLEKYCPVEDENNKK